MIRFIIINLKSFIFNELASLFRKSILFIFKSKLSKKNYS